MALSGFFLMFFLLQHLVINLLSIFSADVFNFVSHFMGTNSFVQFFLQPILLIGFIFHLLMGIVLEIQNRRSNSKRYSFNKRYFYKNKADSNWVSRNMIITGIMILLFLCLHFYDFWIPEINYKYIELKPEVNDRYFYELQHKFNDLWRVILYVVSFVFLSLHLLHGFQSSFQSVGFTNSKRSIIIKKISYYYSILIPLGFIFIAIYHYIYQLFK
tara:strand:- start:673 stop:1317 length:645 start_codon:yes stop_codon:yes gene_type:complete